MKFMKENFAAVKGVDAMTVIKKKHPDALIELLEFFSH
jgi:hypothetical protein